ncbi:DUF1254 domain-containing protein [Rhizobium halophytocola]|nr:DUF1254 domain-containing protein [Rhizobium halophytocola]
MGALLLALLSGLIGAALLHIVIVLSVPSFTGQDAYTRAAAEGDFNQFSTLSGERDAAGLMSVDPFIRTAVCHFDLAERAVRLLAPSNHDFWSVSVFDRAANEVFSMNDRTSVGGMLDLVVASSEQVARIRKAANSELASSIIVDMKGGQGYVVLRAMVPQQSFEDEALDFLDSASCLPLSVN